MQPAAIAPGGLPPTPPNAKPGAKLNPDWNNVFPLNVPRHNGEAPNQFFVGFGDTSQGIGKLLSAESNFPSNMPQPKWTEPLAPKIAIAVAGIIIVLIAGTFAQKLFFEILSAVGLKYGSVRSALSTLSSAAIFVVAAAAGVGGFFLSKKIVKAVPEGPTYKCSYIGTEGFVIFSRGPENDSRVYVPFQGVGVCNELSSLTTVRKNQYGTELGRSTSYSVRSVWRSDAGQVLYSVHETSYSDTALRQQTAFIDAAEKAHFEHRLNQALHALDRGPFRFNLHTTTPGAITVSKERVDFALPNAPPFSVAPSQITGVNVSQGRVSLSFSTGSPVSFDLGKMSDFKVLLGCLAVSGAKIS